MNVPITVESNTRPPAYATDGSAGMDLVVTEPYQLAPGEAHLFKTGIRMAIPSGHVGLIFARSGLSTKHGIVLTNGTGVIDSDYRGEILLSLRNTSDHWYEVLFEDRVAQMVIVPIPTISFEIVDALDPSVRGEGGFGSTDDSPQLEFDFEGAST